MKKVKAAFWMLKKFIGAILLTVIALLLIDNNLFLTIFGTVLLMFLLGMMAYTLDQFEKDYMESLDSEKDEKICDNFKDVLN